MKSLLLFGGLTGFGIGMGISFAQGASWPVCLWHGCVAAYVTALLARWWGQSWRKSLQEALDEVHDETPPALTKLNSPKISKT